MWRVVIRLISIFLLILVVESHNSRFSMTIQKDEDSVYPSNYPLYYNWSSETNSFHIGHLHLPKDAPSLRSDFATLIPPEPWKSLSQVGQDELVNKIFNNKKNGYFVDLASNHWHELSNTYMLEGYNFWKGICIEANTDCHLETLMHRRCTLFVNPVSTNNNEIVTFRERGVLGGIVGNDMDNTPARENDARMHALEHRLTTVTLTTILDFMKAPSVMDYLSLDIEGAELYAMKGLDFSRYIFLVMTVERPKPMLHALFVKHGYIFLARLSTWGETMYIHHSLPNFDQVWKTYHTADDSWSGELHDLVTHPVWTGNLTHYLQEGVALHHKHNL